MKTSISYRWLVVAASTMVLIGFYGTEITFGVFLKPLIAEFNWTRTMLSGAMSTMAGIAGPMGIITGKLTDKYGARLLVTSGAILGGLGFLMLSRIDSLWQIYIFFGVFMGMSQSTGWTPLLATVSKWFSDKRVLAIGIVTSGLTMGHMVFPPLVAYLIVHMGWSAAYIVQAILVVILAIPAIVLLGRRPTETTEILHITRNTKPVEGKSNQRLWSGTVLQAATSAPFLMLAVIGFVTAAGFYFLATHIVAYATDIGMETTSAALIFTFMGISNITGKLLIWRVVERLGNRYTLFILLILQAAAFLLLNISRSLWAFYLLIVVFGFGLGSTIPVRMGMISELFGTKTIGVLLGIIGISWAAGGIAGPILAGYVYDMSQSYTIAFVTGGILMGLGMVATFFLKPTAYSE
jgi:sugar phosphate permease